jgi:ABC-type dipeptide/oligopeptide/nickel transport system permease component
MIRIVLSRIAWLASILVAATIVVFAIVHLSGDPINGFVEPGAPPEVRAQIRHKLGLDDPTPVQYLHFLGQAATGDFGVSWRADQPALRLVLDRLGSTLVLAGVALALAVLIGLGLGSVAVKSRRAAVRAIANLLISVGMALPSFWVGATLVLIFAVHLGWLPSSGSGGIRALILPAITLALQPSAMIARLTETQLREALRSDFIRTARAKGLSETVVFMRHALRSGLGPILAFIGVQIGFLVGGAVVVEGVFAYPGVGLLALNAVQDRDLPVIQAFVVVLALVISLTTMLIDLIARLLDPRIAEETAA